MRTRAFWLLVLSAVLCAVLPARTHAQQVWMDAGGTVSDCGFYFLDDGGPFQTGSPNSNFVLTLCPETPGDDLTFSFGSFFLAPGDQLQLWYADSNAGPPDVTYVNTDLFGVDVGNDLVANPSGCVTWQFISGATGGSNWSALASCDVPCVRPVASVTASTAAGVQPSPVEACIGEPVSFDATGSTAAGTIVDWFWDFGDGTSGPFGATPSHTYTTPGAYPVLLTLTDDAGCTSINSIDLFVYVAAPIAFDLPASSVAICEGGAAVLQLGPGGVQTSPVESPPVAEFGEGVDLPDGAGISYSSSVTFSGFSPGQTVTAPEDIASVLINLEHSFISDLAISISCPNGNSMLLQDWPGGNGGCVDAGVVGDAPPGEDPTLVGTGYDYTWSSTAVDDWQTVAESLLPPATSGCAAGTPPLPADDYAAVGDWTSLVGCPINGTWTLTITDELAGDNGFLFLWSVNFDPAISPDPIQFEATVGSGCDSSAWAPSNPAWTYPVTALDGGGCNISSVVLPDEGTYEYVYSVTDAFGCTADTAVTVTVEPGPEYLVSADATDPNAGVPGQWCEGVPLILNATSVGANFPSTTFSWLVNGTSSGQTLPTYIDLGPTAGTYDFILSIQAPAIPPTTGLCTSSWEGTVEVVAPPTAVIDVSDACTNTPVTATSASTSASGSALTATWTLADGTGTTVATGTGATPSFGIQPEGAYTLTLTVTDAAGCVGTTTANVTVHPAPVADFTLEDACVGSLVPVTVNVPWGSATGTWNFGGNPIATGLLDSLPGVSGTAGNNQVVSLTLVEDFGTVQCFSIPQTQQVDIFALPLPQWDAPVALCEGDPVVISSAGSAPLGTYTAAWTLSDAGGEVATGADVDFTFPTTLGVGNYTLDLVVVDANGCPGDLSEPVEVVDTPDGTFALAGGCEGTPITVTPNGWGAATPVWTWNGAPLTVPDPTVLPTAVSDVPGTQTIGLTLTYDYPGIGAGLSCAATEITEDVEVYAAPDPGFTLDPVCAGEPLTFALDDPVGYATPGATPQWSIVGGATLTDFGGNLGTDASNAAGFQEIQLSLNADYSASGGPVCSASDTQFSLVNPLPVVDYTGDTELCLGEDLILLDASTVPAPSSIDVIEWSVASSSIGPLEFYNPQLDIPGPDVGPYTIALTVTTNDGCSASLPINVEIHGVPVPVWDVEAGYCADAPVDFTSANTVTPAVPLTTTWTVDDGTGPVSTVTDDLPQGVLAPGNYGVTMVVEGAGGCTGQLSTTVEVHALPVPDVILTPACSGLPLTWAPADPAGFLGTAVWTSGGAVITPVGNELPLSLSATPGFVTVEVELTQLNATGASCMATSDPTTVEVFDTPDATFNLPAEVCQEAVIPLDLTGSPGSVGTWTVDGAALAVTGPDFPASLTALPGTYALVRTVGAGSCEDSDSETLVVHPNPVALWTGEAAACEGTAIQWTDNSTLSSGEPLSLEWSVSPFVIPTTSNPVLDLGTPAPGSYTIDLLVESPQGCTAQDQGTLDIYANPVADFTVESVCAGLPMPLTLTNAASYNAATTVDWTWNAGPLTVTDLTALPAVVSATDGPQSLNLTLTEDHLGASCTQSYDTTVTVWPTPVAVIDAPVDYCYDPAVSALFSDASVISSGTFTLSWTLDDGTGPVAVPNEAGDVITLNAPAVGSYAVALDLETVNGCTAAATADLEVFPVPDATFSLPAAVCQFEPVTVPATASGGALIEWTLDGNPLPVLGAEFDPAISADFGTQTIGVTVTSGVGAAQCSDSHDEVLDVEALPVVVWAGDVAVCEGNPVAYTDASTHPQGLPLDVTWTVDDGTAINTVAGPTLDLAVPAVGSYSVALTVSGPLGCSSVDNGTLEVHDVPVADFTLGDVCAGTLMPWTANDPAQFFGAEVWTLGGAPIAPTATEMPASLSAAPGQPVVNLLLTADYPATGVSCSASAIATAEVFAVPVAGWDVGAGYCADVPLAFTSANSIAPAAALTTTWSVDDGTGAVETVSDDLAPGVVAPGTYAVTMTVEGPGGCSDDLAQNVEVHPVPVADFTLGDVCAGTLMPWTADDPAQFFGTEAWTLAGTPLAPTATEMPASLSTGPGQPVVDLVLTADYPATGVSCSASATATAEVFAVPVAGWDVAAGYCADVPLAFTSANTIAPAAALTTTWSVDDGAGSVETISDDLAPGVVAPGTYAVTMTVEGPGGCSDDLAQNVEVHALPEPGFSLSEVCEGEPIAITFDDAASYAAGTPTWTWSGAPTSEAGGLLDPAVSAVPGVVDLALTLSQGFATGETCTADATASTTVHGIPVADFSGPVDLCEGESATYTNLSALSTGEAMTYTWTVVGPSGTVTASDADLLLAVPEVGSFTIDLEATGPGGCSASSTTGTLEVAEGPDAAFFVPADVCVGDDIPVNLVGTGPGGTETWEWNGVPIAVTGPNFPPEVSATPGLQTLTLDLDLAAGTTNCASVSSQTVEVHAVPQNDWDWVPELCESTAFAFNNTSTVSTGVALDAEWVVTDPVGAISSYTGDVLDLGNVAPGLYDLALSVEGTGGCSDDDLVATVEVLDAPEADFTLTDVCEGNPIPWVADDATEFNGSQTWTWNGAPLGATATDLDAAAAAGFGIQTVEVELALTAASGFVCTDTHSATVEVFGQPVAAWDVVPELCEGVPADFTSANSVSSNAALTTTWSVDDGLGPTPTAGEVLSLGLLPPASFDIEMTVEGPGGCEASLTETLTVYDTPEAAFTMQEVCEGTAIPWAPVNFPQFFLGSGSVEWTWDGNPGAPFIPTFTDLAPEVSAGWGTPTVTATVTVTAPTGYTCADTHSETITVHAVPTVAWDLLPESCEGEPVLITSANALASGEAFTTTWTTDDGAGPQQTVASDVDLGVPAPGVINVDMVAEGPGGCSASLSAPWTVVDAPEADFALTEVCEGTAIPWAASDAAQFFGAEAWTWDGNPTTATATELDAAVSAGWGSPSISVTLTETTAAGLACSDTHTETVTVHAVPSAAWDLLPEYCEGTVPVWASANTLASGAAFTTTWTVDGPAGPVSGDAVDWTLAPADPGDYTVTMDVEGPGSCAASLTQAVLVVDAPEAPFTLTDVCAGVPIGWAAVDPAQFLGQADWTWSGAPTTPTATELDPVVSAVFGTQTVSVDLTVTAPLGLTCSDSHTETVEVYANPIAAWDLVPELCEGEEAAFVSNSAITTNAPLTTSWTVTDAGGSSTTAGVDLNLGEPTPGLYDVFLLVEGPGGCTDDLTGALEVYPIPNADFTAGDVCAGTPIPVTLGDAAEFAAATVAWTWNGNPTTVAGGEFDPSVSATYGPQMLEATLTTGFASGFTCSDTHAETAEVFANPVAAWDVVPGLCEGLPAAFTSANTIVTGDPLAVEWTVDDGTGPTASAGDDLDLGVPAIGTYALGMTVTAPGGCSADLTGQLEVHPVPVAGFSAEDVCAGTLIPWTADDPAGQFGTANWTWNAAPILVTGPTLPAPVSDGFGMQTIVLLLEQAYPTGTVCSDQASVEVEVFASPVADWDVPDGWCEGETAAFNATGTIASGLPLDHTWTFTDAAGVQTTTGDALDLGVLPPGVYDLALNAQAPGGCADDLAATVEVHANPVADFTVTDVCAGSSIPYAVGTPVGAAVPNWTWNGDPLAVAGNVLPPNVSAAPGIQQIGLTLVETHASGAVCTDNAVEQVEVFAVPVADIASDSLWCGDQAVLLEQAATGTGDLDFNWASTFGTQTGPTWAVPEGLTGSFPVALEVVSEGGCDDVFTFTLRIDPAPELALSDTFLTDCAPFAASLSAEVGGYAGVLYGVQWTWADEDTLGPNWNGIVDPGTLPVTCTVTAGDADLTCSTSATATLVGVETPVADFTMYPEDPTTRDREVDLVSTSDGSISAYVWTVDGEVEGNAPQIEYTFPPYFGGTYTVCLGVESPFGCGDTTCQVVEVIGGVQVYIPSAFTPDNDGINDWFLPSIHPLAQVTDYRLEIYNRWGDLVFATEDPEEGWLGSYAGGTHFAGNEVYNFVLTINTELDPPYRETGMVTVVR